MKTHQRILTFILPLCITALLGPSSFSQDAPNLETLQKQMQMLMQRVEQLESRNAELEAKLDIQSDSIQQTDTRVDEVATRIESTVTTVSELEENSVDADKVVSSKYGADFYGYVKLDGSYDSSRIFNGNYALYVESEDSLRNDDQFTMTANQTRFGFNLHGPEVWGARSSGKIEGGFYGGGAENKSRFRMRHAYGQLDWEDLDLAVLAGQTSDVVSPLFPKTLNFLIAYAAGNIGYRRPQIRVTKGFQTSEETRLEAQAAITRTIGQDLLGIDTGTDSGIPTVQGRLAYMFPMLTEKPTTIGFSAHYGEEEYDTSTTTFCIHDTWSLNADFTVPLYEKLALTGELFHGKNLDTFYGGILQGVNSITAQEIESTGGWAALAMGPWHDTILTIGYMMEDPQDSHIEPEGRTKNQSIFGNVKYDLSEQFLLGLELSYWDTDYKDLADGNAVRVQTSVVYKF